MVAIVRPNSTLPTTTLTNLPVNGPVVDDNRNLTQQWRLFMQDLYVRVGGNKATSNSQLQTAISPLVGASQVPQVLTSSPFTFVAAQRGKILISDGGITRVQFSRDNVTFFSTGAQRGTFIVLATDIIIISFLTGNAPTVTFFPG